VKAASTRNKRRDDAHRRSSAAAEERLYIKNVVDWTTPDPTGREPPGRPFRCLTCNEPIGEPLALLGSLRRLACREANTPLDPTLLTEWLAKGAEF
jgi:hypothetical protein